MEKSIVLMVMLCLLCLGVNSQEIKGTYIFKKGVLSEDSNLTKRKAQVSHNQVTSIDKTQDFTEILKNSKITVIKVDEDDNVIFRFWNYKDTNLNKIYNPPNTSFSLPLKEFRQLTSPLYNCFKGVSIGAYTVPLRLREIGGDFDFDSNLSLQANVVAGFGKRTQEESIIDGSFGLGITNISLTPRNSSVEQDRSASAFTMSVGLVYKPVRSINFGLFLGWDFLGANDQDVHWDYNGEPWLGLGINISFNEIKTSQTAREGNQ